MSKSRLVSSRTFHTRTYSGMLAAIAAAVLTACGGGSAGGETNNATKDPSSTVVVVAGSAGVAGTPGTAGTAVTAVTAGTAGTAGKAGTAGDGSPSTPSSSIGSASTPIDTPLAQNADSASRRTDALALWREASPSKRVKGSCVGCHGADYLDLARIGTSAATVQRRAVIDGASAAEAQTLYASIQDLRSQYSIPIENPQTFRPFQPGGVLLPGDTSQARDAAFGRELKTLIPTLMGPRIGNLAQAQKARDELIDLARGTNAAGANSAMLNLRSLPVGVPFPRWSADAFNASSSDASQTTLNDWISDVALEPVDADRAQWLGLQQAYLSNPSTPNFWRMFAFVDRLTPQPATYVDSLSSGQRDILQSYAGTKYRSALIGQHLLRTDLAGTTSKFLGTGAVAFNYLLNDSYGVRLPNYSVMPQSNFWDVADVIGRSELQGPLNTSYSDPVGNALAEMGFPDFVVKSTRSPSGSSLGRGDTGQEMRLSWFWLGFTLDPSLYRIGSSGSTQGGEYFTGTLTSEDYKMWIHNAFGEVMKGVSRTLPEAGFGQYDAFVPGYVPKATEFYLGYYLLQARTVRDDWVTAEQKSFYAPMLTNMHRMYLLLYADALARNAADKISPTDFEEQANPMRDAFTAYDAVNKQADEALIQRVKILVANP